MQESHRIQVVGPNGLFNQLISISLHAELACEVATADTVEPWANDRDGPIVMLVDDQDVRAKAALLHLLAGYRERRIDAVAALFNVDPLSAGAHEAVRSGVRGIFFSSCAVTELLTGTRMLLRGDVYIPTQILLDLATNRGRGESRQDDGELTAREREILAHLTTGATNEKIATELFISSHTVKTHVYNIFRKIGVSNRLQAILWATQNLPDSRLLFAPAPPMPVESRPVARAS